MASVENEYPPPAAPGLILAGDVAALRRQLAECEAYTADLESDRRALQAWCEQEIRAARNRHAQTGDNDWAIRQRVLMEVWERIKPVE